MWSKKACILFTADIALVKDVFLWESERDSAVERINNPHRFRIWNFQLYSCHTGNDSHCAAAASSDAVRAKSGNEEKTEEVV